MGEVFVSSQTQACLPARVDRDELGWAELGTFCGGQPVGRHESEPLLTVAPWEPAIMSAKVMPRTE
jgi:hypothetical protein